MELKKSKFVKFLFFILITIGVNVTNAQIPAHLSAYSSTYKKSPRKASLKWFEDARLGLFIHWGVWGKYHEAWAMYNKKIPLKKYQRTAREVDCSGFNALEIVKFAEESGMRYITFVVKHHDGFCLWGTRATDWNSVDYPMGRDFVKELSEVCNKRNMPLFIYYSIGIDWVHPYFIPKEKYNVGRPHYARTPDYFQYHEEEDFEIYREFCKKQLTELCTLYGPIAGFWFDTLGGVLTNPELFKMQEFYDLIHKYQPHALINFKTGVTGTEDILVGERELKSIAMHYNGNTDQDKRIRDLADEAWNKNFKKKAEIAVTSQVAWEWNPKYSCQDVDRLWDMLVDAAENNATLLLNIGLKPNGAISGDVKNNFKLLGERIREQGFPKLNKETYLDLRRYGAEIDKTEQNKTAR